ncbi:hypothetical protein BY458DRAFT_533692 [Sporodiniella umbellata]|nr:hypothetical protein BY458DRAFT_533692 [Sporodiniella umbellata]
MGGQDERLSVLDIETNTILQTSRSKGRVSQLIQNNQNPNIQLVVRQLSSEQFQIYDSREPEDKGTLLKFGQSEDENLSRYVKADLHKNGYMVICGSQKNPKLNFWDLRYTGVSKHVSFSMDIAINKTLNTLFIPEQNTVVTASALRSLDWLDYSVQKDEVIQEFEG